MDKLVHNDITYGIGTIPEEIINEVHRLRAELEKEQARHQTCANGHLYYANSHEYPCPWCVNGKLEQENADLRRAVSKLEEEIEAYKNNRQ